MVIMNPSICLPSETMALMENVAEQVVKEVEDHLKEHEKPPLPQSAKTTLKSQVLEIKNPEHRIRSLISEYHDKLQDNEGFLCPVCCRFILASTTY